MGGGVVCFFKYSLGLETLYGDLVSPLHGGALSSRELCEVYSVRMSGGVGIGPPTQLSRGQGPGSRMGGPHPCLGPGPDSTGENKGLFHSLSVERLPVLGLTAGLAFEARFSSWFGPYPWFGAPVPRRRVSSQAAQGPLWDSW